MALSPGKYSRISKTFSGYLDSSKRRELCEGRLQS
jgi:hypothetical protein